MKVLLGVLAAIGAVALVVWTGGASAPAAVSTIGTWIGNLAGLSGVAATNYGLALIGGGAVTAGGLGKIGGIALLTAALSFSTNAAPELAAFSYSYVQET